MSKNGSMWKRLIRKTIGKREEKVHKDDDVVFVDFEMERKGLLQTLVDDHRDVAVLRHALLAVYLKLSGESSGKTPHYEDESGIVRAIFREVNKLKSHIQELEETIHKLECEKKQAI